MNDLGEPVFEAGPGALKIIPHDSLTFVDGTTIDPSGVEWEAAEAALFINNIADNERVTIAELTIVATDYYRGDMVQASVELTRGDLRRIVDLFRDYAEHKATPFTSINS